MIVLVFLHWLRLSSKAQRPVPEVWQGYSRISGPVVAFWSPLVVRRLHHCSESGRLPDLQIAYYRMAVIVLKKLTVLSTRSVVFA